MNRILERAMSSFEKLRRITRRFIHSLLLPLAENVWFDRCLVKTGYEVSFTRYFYKPQPLRTLEEIRADILAVEKETEGLLGEIIGGGKP